MNILFFTNHYKTLFFHALASRLEKKGHTICWISTSRIWSDWLIDHDVPHSHILDLTTYGPEWSAKKKLTESEEQALTSIEQAGGLTINNIILMDRLLRLKPHIYARSHMYVVQREVKKFLIDQNIKILFLEATWASELLTIMIGKLLRLSTYRPHTIRIPGARFAFFEGHQQLALRFIRPPEQKDFDEAEKFYKHFHRHQPRPAYWYTNNKLPKVRLNWMRKLPTNISRRATDPYDEMQPPPLYLVRKRLKEAWNSGMISLFKPFETASLPSAKPYVLYTVHQQPEASIDVLGPCYSNQMELIKSLARSLPSTHDLYVKEHRVSIGERNIGWYKEVKKIPGVRLIDPFADSHDLINQAALLVTVTGTSAYEAAVYGKPAATAVPMFFGPILTVNGFQIDPSILQSILKKLNKPTPDREPEKIRQEVINFLAWVIAQSFEGIISDPRHQPDCMDLANLDKVSNALNICVEICSSDALVDKHDY